MSEEEPIQYWFESDLFDIEEGEDEETNPRMYGRQLSNWFRRKFTDLGYDVEEVIPEDFGWLVLCQRQPYLLGVACVSYVDYENTREEDPPPKSDEITWCCTVFVEVPFFKRLFSKVDTTEGTEKLNGELRGMLQSEPRISLVDPGSDRRL